MDQFLRILGGLLMVPAFSFAAEVGAPESDTPYVQKSSIYGLVGSCGVNTQNACQPEAFGGKTMCGRSVGQMIKCLSRYIGGQPSCDGNCGDGKMYMTCANGQLTKCGYHKVDPSSGECVMPGAVRAYATSKTKRGKKYGHVEFVCGANLYCSVYRHPLDHPWPKPIPDACWIPNTGLGTPGGTFE